MRLTYSSVRSRTRVSTLSPRSLITFWLVVFPMPKMYVRLISNRLSRGMSMLAIRAIRSLSLPLLVPRVLADDHYAPMAADHLALVAHLLDARFDLHAFSYLYL